MSKLQSAAGCVAVISGLLFAPLSAIAADNEGLAMAKQVYEAAKKSLRSGSGTGQWKVYLASEKNDELSLEYDAEARIQFKDQRYYVRLAYKKHPWNEAGRIIIYDSHAIFVNVVSPRIRPFGSEGQILEPPGLLISGRVGFTFNPARSVDCVFPLDSFAGNESNLHFEKRPNGDYLGTYDKGVTAGEFVLSKACEYNPVLYRILLTKTKKAIDVYEADWKKQDTTWYLCKWKHTDYSNGRLAEIAVFEYSDFKPNAVVDPNQFTFKALELPPGARMQDLRRGQHGTFPPKADRTDECE
jgi:hypothetical protein